MKEYIERDAALEIAFERIPMSLCVSVSEYDAMNRAIGMIYKLLRDIPAADVEEVRHGRWIKSESSGLYKCSKCGRYATNSDVLNWEYCNCGAKMDGGAE